MKCKVVALCLCILLLLPAFSVRSIAAENSHDPLTVKEATTVSTSPLTVDVPFALSFADATGINLNIRVNPHLVDTAKLVSPAACLSNTLYTANQTDDKVKVAIASASPISNEGVLFSLRLTLKSTPTEEDELCKLLQIKINERIISQATDRILLTGVTNGALYERDVIVNFNEGTATLNGAPYVGGTAITEDGSYRLIVTDLSGKTREINFTVDKIPDISVTVSWTNMSFVYSEGDWDPSSHTYGTGTWSPVSDGGGTVAVTNACRLTVETAFQYVEGAGNEGISGSFLSDGETVTGFVLSKNESKSVVLTLSGVPSTEMNQETLGVVTVTISEKKEG